MTEIDPGLTIGELTPEQRIALAAQIVTEHSAQVIAGDEKYMPQPLYHAWAIGNPVATLEVGLVAPSETSDGTVDVYMLRRKPDDPIEAWQNKLHIPGVGLIYSDYKHNGEKVVSRAVERAIGETEGGLNMLANPIPFDVAYRLGGRGPEVTPRLLIPVSGKPGNGEFYDVATMLAPPNNEQLLETHDEAITSVQKAAHELRVFPDLRPLSA